MIDDSIFATSFECFFYIITFTVASHVLASKHIVDKFIAEVIDS